MHTGSCTLAHARMLVHANILEIAEILVKACSFFCTRMFILVNAWSFFLCMGGCIPALHAYVLVLAPVLVLKFWRMVVGIRLLAYRCMTVSLRMQVGW